MTPRLIATAAATGLLVAGCQAGRAQQEPVELPRLSVEAQYGRHAAVRGKVDLRVANSGDEPVEIATYQVRHPMFDVVPPTHRASTLPADGRARLVPVAFGAPRCDVTDATDARVVLGVRERDGVREVVLPLVDGTPGLGAWHETACASARVERVAAFSLGPPWSREDTPDGPRLRSVLRLERRAPGSVEVGQVLGSILFTVRASPAVLEPGADRLEVPLVVSAERCDRHALIESKTSATFPLFAGVDGAEPVRLTVTADSDGRAALQALLDESCGAA